MKKIILLLSSILIASCGIFPLTKKKQAFTTENIMKVHHGMSSKEVQKLFGNPKNISQDVCGGNTAQTWTCTRWEYEETYNAAAQFTFSGDTPDKLILNNFTIDRK